MSSTRMSLSRTITIVILVVAALGLLYTVISFQNKEKPAVLEIGQAAPNFTLQTLDGKAVKLSDYKGKVVMINYWATWCEDCRTEMPAVEKAYESYKNQGLVVLGVNVEEGAVSVKGFVNNYNLTYPILLDKDGSTATNLYNVKPIPTTFFVDRQGILRAKAEQPMTPEFIDDTLKPLLNTGS